MLGSLGIELHPIKTHMDDISEQIVRQLASSPPDAKLVEINIGGYPVTLDLGCIIIGSVIISDENLSHFFEPRNPEKSGGSLQERIFAANSAALAGCRQYG